MLAILLEITWTFSSWAIIPVAAVWSARMMIASQTYAGTSASFSTALRRRWGECGSVGELLDRAAPQVPELLQHGGDLRVGSRHLDHARHLDHGVHVRLLDRALRHTRGGARILRCHAGRRAEQAGAVFLQPLDVVEMNEAQLAARRVG